VSSFGAERSAPDADNSLTRTLPALDLLSHSDFTRLHPTGSHPERPERIQALLDTLPCEVTSRRATAEELTACHEPGYVETVAAFSSSGRTGYLDPDTVCTPTSYELARLAAGTAIEAVERSGFALGRPPGHHALPDRAMGCCLFNNVAVAARFAQRELGLSRVAIFDWDVHHGNGTQDMFWDDASVLFVSLHRWPFYPGSGGPGEGNATTVNLPLSAGAGDAEYVAVMEDTVEPAIRSFEPDLLIVSAGFDAAAGDPLGGMLVTAEGFRELARRAGRLCDRVACVLEGGYNVETLPELVRATVDGLAPEALARR
jgi:acetoin utilization deacetylase AcuC-like enzyme